MNIGVVGAGYVGLVTAACLAELGNVISVYDRDLARIDSLNRRQLPFHEPGLLELIVRNSSRLAFTIDEDRAVAGRDIVFIAVSATAKGGVTDATEVCSAAAGIARFAIGRVIVVNKSTVPVNTADLVECVIRRVKGSSDLTVVSNPEFLREGTGVEDFLHPDRIVLGCDDIRAEQIMRALYAPLSAPFLVTDRRSAEFIKLVSNAFLATRLSFVNEIVAVGEELGVDERAVLQGIGMDKRIGTAYLQPGVGFGGSCLPKSVRALVECARGGAVEAPLLSAVLSVNALQVGRMVTSLVSAIGDLHEKCIAVLGLAFKPGTDDIRESPATSIIKTLIASGARVKVHDPVVSETTASEVTALGAQFLQDVWACLNNADAMVVATAWPQYRALDPSVVRMTMQGRAICDFHKVLDKQAFRLAGFICR